MSLFDNRPYTIDRIFRIVLSIIVLAGLVILLKYISSVVLPFIVATILAYMTYPLMSLIQKLIKKRGLSVLITLALIIGVFVLVGTLLVPMVLKELRHMGTLLTGLLTDETFKQRAMQYIPNDWWLYIQQLASGEVAQKIFNMNNINSIVVNASKTAAPGIQVFFSGAKDLVFGLVNIFFVILYFVFILIDYEKITQSWKNLIPPAHKNFVVGMVQDFTDIMNRYFRAQALIALIVAIVYSIGFSIIGLPMGILLGIALGVLCMIPYLQVVGILPAAFLTLMYSLETGNNFWIALLFTGIVFLVVELLQDIVLTPRIMGKVIGMNPAIILLSISIWGTLLGVLGLLIALPMTYFLLCYYKRFIAISEPEATKQE